MIRPVLLRGIALAAGVLFAAPAAAANSISVDPPSVRVGESFTVTIALEGAAASAERFEIPLARVELRGAPSVQYEFRRIDGRSSRSKLLRYEAVALEEGTGSIGPIRIEADGAGVLLPAALIRIHPAAPRESGDAASALRTMEEGAREAVVLDVEADRRRVVVGEEVVVTWILYARDSVTSPTITDLPDLPDFWVEEFPTTTDRETTVFLDGGIVQRVVVRKVAIFPLRSGELEIGPLEVRIGVVRPYEPFRFGRPTSSSVVNVLRGSPVMRLGVDPVPAGVQVVGDFAMTCGDPVARPGGPVSFSVRLEGDGSLRAAPPPAFERAPAAEVEMEESRVTVDRGRRIRMTKRWNVLLIPEGGGKVETLEIPPLSIHTWNPSKGRIEVLRCDPGRVTVDRGFGATPVGRAWRAERDAGPERRGSSLAAPVFAGALVLAGGAAWLMVARRRDRLRPLERRILARSDAPRAMREEMRAILRERSIDPDSLYRADSPLADAHRALSSLLDVLEKEPWEKERSGEDLGKRVREFVRRL